MLCGSVLKCVTVAAMFYRFISATEYSLCQCSWSSILLQCDAGCSNVLQCVAVCGSMLQWFADLKFVFYARVQCELMILIIRVYFVAACSSALQCVSVCCSLLQWTAVCNWSKLQRLANLQNAAAESANLQKKLQNSADCEVKATQLPCAQIGTEIWSLVE